MKLYRLFDNEKWVDDMTADDIAEKIGCSRIKVIKSASMGILINGRYAAVYDGDSILTGRTSSDRKLLEEFTLITSQLKGMASA